MIRFSVQGVFGCLLTGMVMLRRFIIAVMETSNWITIGALLIPMLMGFGVVLNEIKSLSARVGNLEKQMRKVLTVITTHKGKIRRLEKDVAKLQSRS
jgi:hypothetical protein